MKAEVAVSVQRRQHRARDRADAGLDAVAVLDQFRDQGANALRDGAAPAGKRGRFDVGLDHVVEAVRRHRRSARQAGQGPVPFGDERNLRAPQQCRQKPGADAERAVAVPVRRRELSDRQVERRCHEIVPDVPVLHRHEADGTRLETRSHLRRDEEAPHRRAGPGREGRRGDAGDAGNREVHAGGRLRLGMERRGNSARFIAAAQDGDLHAGAEQRADLFGSESLHRAP